MRISGKLAAISLVALGCTADAGAQNIGQQVAARGNGNVELVFAAKPGVCGDGAGYISTGTDEHGRRSSFTRSKKGFSTQITDSGRNDYHRCEPGPIRAVLQIANGEVVDVETFVGGGSRSTHNVSARAAVDYLLDLAETSARANTAKGALLPAILADSVDVTARLLRIGGNQKAGREVRKSAIFWAGQQGGDETAGDLEKLMYDADNEVAKSATFAIAQLDSDRATRMLLTAARNNDVASEVRKSAVFWLGQAAGDKATEGLVEIAESEDTEIKKQAVFALSQVKGERSTEALMQLARTSNDPEVRKSALFWLGQSRDPRVLTFFEEILLK